MYYLYTNHDNIEYEDVAANKHCLTDPFDNNQPLFNIFNRYKDTITIVICTEAEVWIILMFSTETQYVLLVVYFYTQTEINGRCHYWVI